MSTIVVLRGLPGCGKSTLARWWVAQHPTWRSRVCLDDLRAMMHGGWSADTESQVVAARNGVVRELILDNKDVIVDETMLPYQSFAGLAQAVFAVPVTARRIPILVVWDMTDVPLEECVARNAVRTGSARVPEERIREMHELYIEGRDHPLSLLPPAFGLTTSIRVEQYPTLPWEDA